MISFWYMGPLICKPCKIEQQEKHTVYRKWEVRGPEQFQVCRTLTCKNTETSTSIYELLLSKDDMMKLYYLYLRYKFKFIIIRKVYYIYYCLLFDELTLFLTLLFFLQQLYMFLFIACSCNGQYAARLEQYCVHKTIPRKQYISQLSNVSWKTVLSQ